MVMWTPRFILCLAKLISKQAILAPVTRVFIATTLEPTLRFRQKGLTLTGDSTVQSVTFDHETLPCRLSVCLQNIDGLDGVFLLSSSIDGQDCLHSVDSHGCEQVIITIHQPLFYWSEERTYAEMILEDMEVFATLIKASRPSLSTLVDS
jgi:hypothetical protein